MTALDLMLKSLIASREFNEQPNKNWQSISRLIPGTTVKEVRRPEYGVNSFPACLCVCVGGGWDGMSVFLCSF